MGAIPKGDRDLFFQHFKVLIFIPFKKFNFTIWIDDSCCFAEKVTWKVEDEEKVKKNFHTKASHTLSQMFKDTRQEGKRPKWIDNSVWNNLLEQWNMSVSRSKCDTTKKNRLSEKGGCLHIG